MSTNRRFSVNASSYVIDSLNPSNSGKAIYCDLEGPPDDYRLRESLLFVRLREIVDKLIINLRPPERMCTGQEYQPANEESRSIYLAVFNAIRASHLNSFDPAISVQRKFDGILNRRKEGIRDYTSLWLFREDVERLLRDLYGEIEDKAFDNVLYAVLTIAEGLTRFARPDLWKEYNDAENADRMIGIGLPEGYNINGSMWRRGLHAREELGARIHEVRDNPAGFSDYTVEFVNWLAEAWPGLTQPRVEREAGCPELEIVPF
jgi:hypothetical protein